MNYIQDEKINPLKILNEYGQSVWLDYIRRSLIRSGGLQRMINEDGLHGVTSNPTIFEKAIAGSTDYAEALEALQEKKLDAMTVYEQLAICDIQDAADVLRSVYKSTNRRDGYVSLEVSPYKAHDTQGTIEEARRLWKSVGRENLMVKVPGTPEGVPAFERLIGEGINVNVTLIFGLEVYERVALAYISGLEKFAMQGGDVSRIASVASFFVSRIDSAVDAIVTTRLKSVSDEGERALLQSVMGKIAIANAKLAYQKYNEIFQSDRWRKLAEKGAQTQRVLWASTSTKNPNYRDVIYIEELIGKDTVNTMPPSTFEAFRDHGHPRASLEEDVEAAHETMETLERLGISMKKVTDDLTHDGVRLFAEAFDKLLGAVDSKRKVPPEPKIARQSYTLPGNLSSQVKAALKDWQTSGKVRKLWARDATLWTNSDEAKWLGWLGITEHQPGHAKYLQDFVERIKKEKFSHALLLGMGGSSLCPEVMKMTFGKIAGYPELHVLDSTDPAQIRAFENKIDIANTLFIVSSKSGTTLEPNIFKQYFFQRVKEIVGADKTGDRFIAITDPGSKLQQDAESEKFRHVFHGVPSVGGRYSALSDFGMVPAAIMGIDAHKFLDRADEMAVACSSSLPAEENPGVVLGAILGVLAKNGRDKATIIASPRIRDFGAWLEQLLAESTGKNGKGIIPVDRERLGSPDIYGNDRIFIYLKLESEPDASQDAAIDALEKSGQPVVRISVADLYDLGQEFFRWEMATAVAGAIIGINPFDQPDVEASKTATRRLTAEYEKTGSLPHETPIFEENGIKLFTDEKNASSLHGAAGSDKLLAGYLRAHLNRLESGDYFAVLAYVEMNEANEKQLQTLRHAVRDSKRVATCLGFGPRFLHSTGQAYKGGPDTGVFLQITCDDAADLPIPGQGYTFGIVKAAQARGDFEVLAERKRRVLRIHLGPDVWEGLERLRRAMEEAVK